MMIKQTVADIQQTPQESVLKADMLELLLI